ncbi:MAG: PDDEXK nuclease domain-containing protein [Legionella sp.]|nr:PDDEXK nuclease domain-containing protein [Legionella sp.]
MTSKQLNFTSLVVAIQNTHETFAIQASTAVNVCLTMRNWLIGHYIVEYELQGADRANYGEYLLDKLSEQLVANGLKRMDIRELRRFKQFYTCYPQIRETLSPEFMVLPSAAKIVISEIRETLSPELKKSPTAIAGSTLVERLSFSHFVEFLQIDQPLKRLFYEVETIRGNWSIRELRRQIATQYFERSGLSLDKEALAKLAHQSAEKQEPQHVIRDPYVFEFLGLKPQEVMTERKLEEALLDKLQVFLLELGHGFCFEARQKRLIIGGEHCFVDLVFYHRILKCHVLIELKNDAFRHENISQLNTYVSYYKEYQMSEGDQPPIGILLCTQKNHEMVKFALADMKNSLFVSRYQLQLPLQEEIEAFLQQAIAELDLKN